MLELNHQYSMRQDFMDTDWDGSHHDPKIVTLDSIEKRIGSLGRLVTKCVVHDADGAFYTCKETDLTEVKNA